MVFQALTATGMAQSRREGIMIVVDYMPSDAPFLGLYRPLGVRRDTRGIGMYVAYTRDPETGLYYEHSRVYHSTLGRLLRREPVGPSR